MFVELIWDQKSALAEYRLAFDMTPQLSTGDKLTGVEVVSVGVDTDRVDFTDTGITFWVSGGTPGLVATINFIGQTLNGETIVQTSKMGIY